MRRSVAVGAAAAVAVAAAAGGWLAGRSIKSPDQAALEAEPPPASLITVEVELAELAADVISRADVGYDEPVSLSLSGALGDREAALVVTSAPERGARLAEGAVVIEIAGRPVFLLTGAVPVYRDLRPRDRGPDVAQLEDALARLGHFDGEPDRLWDHATSTAVEAWYEAAGYRANGISEAERDALQAARDRRDTARDALAAAEKSLVEARRGPADLEVRRARTEVAAAQSALQGARLGIEQAVADARTSQADADRAVVDAELAVADADRAVVDAELAVADADRAVVDAELFVADADRAVVDAELFVADADRAVVDAELFVADADRAVVDAELFVADADRAVVDAELFVADADRAVVDAELFVADADRAVVDAELSRQAAKRAVGDAERERDKARQAVEDARWAVDGAMSAREQAAHRLTEAELRWQSAQTGVHPDTGAVPSPSEHETLRLASRAAERSLADAERAVAAAERVVAAAERAAEDAGLAVPGAQRAADRAVLGVEVQQRAADRAVLGVEVQRRAADRAVLGVEDARRAADRAVLGVEVQRRAADRAVLGVEDARRAADRAVLGVEVQRRAADRAVLGVEVQRRAAVRARTDVERRRADVPGPEERSQAAEDAGLAVRQAEDRLSAAEESLAVLLAPPDTEELSSRVEQARADVADAETRLDDLEAAAGVWLPAGELIVLGRLPVRVDLITAARGRTVSGSFMTVTGAELAVRGSVSERDVEQVSEGADAYIDDRSLAEPIPGTIRLVDSRAGTRGVAPDRHYIEIVADGIPEDLVGRNVKIVIPVGGTDGAVLVVPVAALSATADGSTRVEVEQADGTTRFVSVAPGLSTGGRVEVTPLVGALTDGDRVVVGQAAGE